MVAQWSQFGDVNVLASAVDWAWPEAVRNIFKPRGVNLLMAENPGEFVNIIATTRIHTAIVDVDSSGPTGWPPSRSSGWTIRSCRASC